MKILVAVNDSNGLRGWLWTLAWARLLESQVEARLKESFEIDEYWRAIPDRERAHAFFNLADGNAISKYAAAPRGKVYFEIVSASIDRRFFLALGSKQKVELLVQVAIHSIRAFAGMERAAADESGLLREFLTSINPPDRNSGICMALIYDMESVGLGSASDVRYRHMLEERLDLFLQENSLGYVEGGSAGGGTMEVFCIVNRYGKAKAAIMRFLRAQNLRIPREIAREPS